MLVTLGGWLAVVAVTLIQGQLPDAAVLGVPAAIILALAPPAALTRKRTRARTKRDDPNSEDQ